MRPLLVAPRPKPDEALSSWVRRLAARYDCDPRAFVAALGLTDAPDGWASLDDILDQPENPGLDERLAHAARLDPAVVAALRPIARPENAGWLRHHAACCPRCFAQDMARDGEVHVRAAWRTHACAVCDRHGTPLRGTDAVGAPPALQFVVIGGRLRVAEADEGSADTSELGAVGDPRPLDGLRQVLALQAALGRVLRDQAPPDGWTCAVLPAALPDACALLIGAVAAVTPRSGQRPPHRWGSLLTACAAILETLSGRPVGWPYPLASDLVELVQVMEPVVVDRFVAAATTIGGFFATAVTRAVAWDHLTRQARSASWPALLLADPAIWQQLDGLPEHYRARGLAYLARKLLADTRRACTEAGALSARA